ncbi:MAG: PHP domain-containing protein [Eubacteriales bacterium]|nr:PHP domain-containing protein [Eubacteriales bacterium]
MIKKMDLHMHSFYSIDGEHSPSELVERAAEKGVELISLTDHNSVRGVAEAKRIARAKGIHFINGIELDCVCRRKNVHILGYGLPEEAEETLDKIEESILVQERYAGGIRIELIRQCGIAVDGAWLLENAINGVITGELIAESALNHEANRNLKLLDPYRPGGERSDCPYLNFYWDFCSHGKPAYVPIRYKSSAEIIRIIHENDGIAILAHPGISIGREKQITKQLMDEGIDGIEVYTSYHDAEMTRFYRNVAEENNLVMTCGSDYHGKTKPTIEIGSVSPDEGCFIIEKFALSLLDAR